ncbi:hypothetical protein J6590_013694 [Homalodisca vitripennis]|nr:hypothetical protein J6590_013694 [Homalodisca vitripennis]
MDARRKSAHANVTVRSPGTGLININGHDLSYFSDIQAREQKQKMFGNAYLEALQKLLRNISIISLQVTVCSTGGPL